MPTQVTPVQVVIDYSPRGPKVIRATDDDPGDPNFNDNKYHSRGDASVALLTEVSAKIIAHRKNGTEIQLTIDDDGQHIIEDPASSLPAASSAVTAAESADAAVSEDGEDEDETKTLKPQAKKRSGSGKSRKTRKKKDDK
jgi:hypothetical protein